MSARKSIYTITDTPCDGGVSPNAYIAKITAEVRLHFPPSTVTEEEVRSTLEATYNKAVIQMHEYFEGRAQYEDSLDTGL